MFDFDSGVLNDYSINVIFYLICFYELYHLYYSIVFVNTFYKSKGDQLIKKKGDQNIYIISLPVEWVLIKTT